MPVEVSWHIAHRVIGERFWGKVDIDDIDLHINSCVQFLAEAQTAAPQNTVHLLSDGTDVESMYPLYKAGAQGIRPMRFSNRGLAFLITRNRTHRTIAEVTARVGRFPMHVFSDRQTALDAVVEQLAKEDQHRRHTDRRRA